MNCSSGTALLSTRTARKLLKEGYNEMQSIETRIHTCPDLWTLPQWSQSFASATRIWNMHTSENTSPPWCRPILVRLPSKLLQTEAYRIQARIGWPGSRSRRFSIEAPERNRVAPKQYQMIPWRVSLWYLMFRIGLAGNDAEGDVQPRLIDLHCEAADHAV
jgi:hypothetical protein